VSLEPFPLRRVDPQAEVGPVQQGRGRFVTARQ
jgi:hypothetical protein